MINSKKPIRIGVVGMGRAFTLMIPTFVEDSRVTLTAGADPRREAQQQFIHEFGGQAFEDCESLLSGSEVDLIYLATPAVQHLNQVRKIAEAGKHILLEKPIALSISEGKQINDIIDQSGILLIVGHSHGFDRPIQLAREKIISGQYGELKFLTTINFTDFMYRPRRPDELMTELGGGVVFSQAAHQIDVIRILSGGIIKSIKANTYNWDPHRNTEGAYNALLTLEKGRSATAVYNGYAHFDSDEFMDWTGELGNQKDPKIYGQTKDRLLSGLSKQRETDLKASYNFGGKNYIPYASQSKHSNQYQHFGTVIASCEKADIRSMPWGLAIYDGFEQAEIKLQKPIVPRSEVIDEVAHAIEGIATPIHDGKWALANLEASLAIIDSARTESTIELKNQCSYPND